MTDVKYTEEPIKGNLPKTILPEGYALILEGGGMRGFYTGGVLDAFMEEGIMFPYIIGVSAGVANSLSYLSGQQKRNRQIIEKYVAKNQYLSYRNLIFKGSIFDFDYSFGEVPDKHIFWDREIFNKNKVRFLTGTSDLNTGKELWFDKEVYNKTIDVAIASCSVPMVSKIVKYEDYELLDGGITAPIPIEKSIADGNKFHVIVLTRNEGYRKKAFKNKRLLNLYFKKYPNFVEAMLRRHEVYNKQIELCEQLERDGKALIIRPQKQVEVGRISKNIKKLLEIHDEGFKEGKDALKSLNKKLKKIK